MSVPASQDAPAAPRSFTLRALLTGGLLVLIIAWLAPINDWALRNTGVYSHFMPPALTVVLLLLGVVVNPLLGRRRFLRGELIVVATMVLALGGVASSGLMRYLPTAIAGPARVLARNQASHVSLQVPLSAKELSHARQALRERLTEELAGLDRDGDAVLNASELPGGSAALGRMDANGDGVIDVDEWMTTRLASDPDLLPTWRWAHDSRFYLGLPEAGRIPVDDPDYRYQVDGFFEGVVDREGARVSHGTVLRWVDEAGTQHRQRVVAGPAKDGELSLTSPNGLRLRGLRSGEAAGGPSGRMVTVGRDGNEGIAGIAARELGDAVLARSIRDLNRIADGTEPAVGSQIELPAPPYILSVTAPVPWAAWLPILLAWSPLLLGALASMIAIAILVRRQWIENERLPYPIAEATLALMAEPTPGRRLAAIFTDRLFLTGLLIAAAVITWRALFVNGLVPVNIETSLDLISKPDAPFAGHPWALAYQPRFLFVPTIFFSLIALSFFLPLDLSFSLWFFFVLTNVVQMGLNQAGYPATAPDFSKATVGGFAMMAVLILWVGRLQYWRLLRAAFGFGSDPAAPFVWVLLVGVAMMGLTLMLAGASLGAASLAIVLFLGAVLVLARMVAEAGIPFLQTPNGVWLHNVLFTITGFSVPVGALVPLTMIGLSIMADTRESLLPYAVNAGHMAHRGGLGTRRHALLIGGTAVIGGLVAFGGMLAIGYGGQLDDPWALPLNSIVINDLANGLGDAARPGASGADRLTADADRSWLLYGAGATLTAGLGMGRLYVSGWPLHPLGYICSTTYPVWQGWFSLMLGWLCKLIVMRYGGPASYKRLKFLAIGLIAGEALAAGGYMLVKLLVSLLSGGAIMLPDSKALPG